MVGGERNQIVDQIRQILPAWFLCSERDAN